MGGLGNGWLDGWRRKSSTFMFCNPSGDSSRRIPITAFTAMLHFENLSCPTENDLVAPSKVEWFILLNYLIQQFDKAYCTAHILAYPNE